MEISANLLSGDKLLFWHSEGSHQTTSLATLFAQIPHIPRSSQDRHSSLTSPKRLTHQSRARPISLFSPFSSTELQHKSFPSQSVGARFHHSTRSFSLPGWLREGTDELRSWQELGLIARFTSTGLSCPAFLCLSPTRSCLVSPCSIRQCQLRLTAQAQHSTGKKAEPYKFLSME